MMLYSENRPEKDDEGGDRVTTSLASGAANQVRLFGNMKKMLSDGTAADENPYEVSDHYYETGIFRTIACDPTFNNLTLAMICLNALYMGIDADWNNEDSLADAAWPYQFCEHTFCLFYTVEITVRF